MMSGKADDAKENLTRMFFRSEGNCKTFGCEPNRHTLTTSCNKHQEKIVRYAAIYSGQFLDGFHWIKWPFLFFFSFTSECLFVFSILHNELLIRTRPRISISKILLSNCWPVTPMWFLLWATYLFLKNSCITLISIELKTWLFFRMVFTNQ